MRTGKENTEKKYYKRFDFFVKMGKIDDYNDFNTFNNFSNFNSFNILQKL